MLWVLIGALSATIFDGTHMDAALKGLVVGIPILMGSALRVPLGLLSDRLGGRSVGLALLLFLYAPLTLAWRGPATITTLISTGVMLGCAGASFAIVLPLASRWYSKERQGLVMGIAAAGNSGTVIANMFAPRLAQAYGWQTVFGLALLPLSLALLIFAFAAKDAPGRAAVRTAREYFAAVSHPDTMWFCFFYSITFGGYVGLSSFLPVFLRDQYGMTAVNAGSLTALAAFAGSFSRPLGGYLADRFGGAAMLRRLLFGIALAYAAISALPALSGVAPVLVLTMVGLGLGNGVVFQLVPQRFQKEIGSVTGLIGAVGGIGGFFLPTLLGSVKQFAGSYAAGFLVLAGLAVLGGISIRSLHRQPRTVTDSRLAAEQA
jgi:NNP family nitrate/nitrite transporter-like MFS transporter